MKRVSRLSRKKKLIARSGMALAACAGLYFGALAVFTKGIDRLPDRPCEGAVERETIADILPAARTAEERSRLDDDHGIDSREFLFHCSVLTSDGSLLSGDAESGDRSVEDWSSGWVESPDSSSGVTGDITAFATDGAAAIYVSCAPPGRSESKSPKSRALIVEASTLGETKAQGAGLQQDLVDFAYELAEHAYKVGECPGPRKFPDQSPRLHSP